MRVFPGSRSGGAIECWGSRTGGVGQFILATLDLVLQTLGLAPGGGNLGLHLFAGHVGCHFDELGPLRAAVEMEGELAGVNQGGWMVERSGRVGGEGESLGRGG